MVRKRRRHTAAVMFRVGLKPLKGSKTISYPAATDQGQWLCLLLPILSIKYHYFEFGFFFYPNTRNLSWNSRTPLVRPFDLSMQASPGFREINLTPSLVRPGPNPCPGTIKWYVDSACARLLELYLLATRGMDKDGGAGPEFGSQVISPVPFL